MTGGGRPVRTDTRPDDEVLDRLPAWSLAVMAMLLVQIGSALSVEFFPVVGPVGTGWLRLTAAAIIFLAIRRPPIRDIDAGDARLLLALGAATAVLTMAFLSAIDRIPLGTAVAIEFLGPITVGVVGARSRRNIVWPFLALVGVALLTEPWTGTIDLVGVAFALTSAVGWGSYIVLTQRVGDRFDGLDGLSITIPIAAVITAFFGLPQAFDGLSWKPALAAFGLAIVMPVLPFSLELVALRRLTASAFGTLMAIEPAIGLTIGALLLSQSPSGPQLAGIAFVVVAGIGAERTGRRRPQYPIALTPT